MDWGQTLTLAGMVAGATWLLRSSLAELRSALVVHVEKNKAEHRAMEARILRLERKGRS